jgi:flavodoxin
MKTMIVFDTMFGNTEKIARAIGAALSGEVVIKKADETSSADLQKIDLLLIGSPVQGGRPLKATQKFIDSLTESQVKGLKTAAFDTRMTGNFPKLFGWAAKRISDALKKKGVEMVVEPEGFFVKGKEGPLLEGELEKAGLWAKKVQQAANR